MACRVVFFVFCFVLFHISIYYFIYFNFVVSVVLSCFFSLWQTKAEVDELANLPALGRLGAEPLHGGLTQAARESTLARFRSGRTKVHVAKTTIAEMNISSSFAGPLLLTVPGRGDE